MFTITRRLAVVLLAGLTLTGLATMTAQAGTPVSAGPAVVHVPRHGYGHETVTARFRVCVRDVTAYAEPASGDYSTFSTVHRGRVPAGHAVRVRLDFGRADEPGRWYVVTVTGTACGSGRYVILSPAVPFTVVTR